MVVPSKGPVMKVMDRVVLRQTLDVLAARGESTPEGLLAEATPKDSPVHGFFEWNDNTAGHYFRLIQAAMYIKAIKYVPAPNQEPLVIDNIRVIHIRGRSASELRLTGTDATMQAIMRLEADLLDLRKRYGVCPELRPVLEGPIRKAMEDLTRLALSLPLAIENDPS